MVFLNLAGPSCSRPINEAAKLTNWPLNWLLSLRALLPLAFSQINRISISHESFSLPSVSLLRMGGVSEGDDVLARWSDGLLYLGNVKRVDGVKQCCLVRFEDNSEFWVLRKDIHSSLNVELLCYYCHSGCRFCKHELNALLPPPITGYHPECHTPAIEPEADSDSWICRQCVFAVATKRGGALKRGRFARLMQFMKLRLPYQLSSLDWDPQHLTNQQQCYCYCAGPGE
uniref:Tudor domain-containing protein n=1 Tax=Monopterus albus TaxID=43700 RepID=A0A3Q3JMI6_MONAL